MQGHPTARTVQVGTPRRSMPDGAMERNSRGVMARKTQGEGLGWQVVGWLRVRCYSVGCWWDAAAAH